MRRMNRSHSVFAHTMMKAIPMKILALCLVVIAGAAGIVRGRRSPSGARLK